MDRKAINAILMRLVMLDYLFHPQIKHRNGFLRGAGQNALLSRMESNTSYRWVKAIKAKWFFLSLNVPNQQLFVLSTWTRQVHVWADFGTFDPIIVT